MSASIRSRLSTVLHAAERMKIRISYAINCVGQEADDAILYLKADLAAAKKQINEYTTAMFEAGVAYDKCQKQLTARDAEIERLREQMSKYGNHTDDCAWNPKLRHPCSCGFSDTGKDNIARARKAVEAARKEPTDP